jgi:hypothetical protein
MAAAAPLVSLADVTPAVLFADNMIIQQKELNKTRQKLLLQMAIFMGELLPLLVFHLKMITKEVLDLLVLGLLKQIIVAHRVIVPMYVKNQLIQLVN